jgi:nucleoside-diphosphate-sugar epimerase
MARILVTGGAGFIGLHLARALALRGDNVDLLDNFGRAVRDAALQELLSDARVRMLELNLLDGQPSGELPRDYDVIFHFAAIIGVAHVLQRPYAVLVQNCQMLANAIELARRQQRLSRLVFASTSEVYAGTLSAFGMKVPTPEDTPLTVADLAQPRTSYMLSKIYGEAMCQQSQLPFTIVRPHNVYGPRMGMSHVIPELLQRAHAATDGGTLQVYSTSHRRTFCYIDDAVELLLRVIDTDGCRNTVLNLGSTEAEIPIGEVAQTVIDVVGRKLLIEPLPETPGSPSRRAPEMGLAQRLTGYRSKVGLREGVARTYDWYRRNVFEGSGVTAR